MFRSRCLVERLWLDPPLGFMAKQVELMSEELDKLVS